ncbi:MAG: hypothetical protein KJ904_07595 [Alphaproteobacteria bacterium]|nr:hypothetical protein [Alphaproteobacteria bacterium]MBU0796765.1 hypothetical protein [Alphaproteobacteria bacterium]MBU0887012.1 hypothetical protein [Alphaproteobacteria bacterium]MBU1811880.1 hypothetical protein [Alphaproteobacteria bacterium]
MALQIDTFSNLTGGQSFFKAIGHPLSARPIADLLTRLSGAGKIAVYDPLGFLQPFAEIQDCAALDLAGVYVQNIDQIGRTLLGQPAQPVTGMRESGAQAVFVVAYDAGRLVDHIRHLVPQGAVIVTLDDARLPAEMLSNQRNYLDPLNFATNMALFRDSDGHHTRLTTANYWAGYGAKDVSVWCCLFDAGGQRLADWRQNLPNATASLVLDSQDIRARLGLGEFCGSLFIHVIGARGHDVVKYAMDTYGDDPSVLSCTHDANAWPADFYAGLPAPREGDTVLLWLQNAHPCPIPAGGIGLNLMGQPEIAWLDREIPGFGTYALDVADLLPGARWPQQIEIQAGKYVVRPRYEIVQADGRRRIAHANVERTDLKPDPRLPELSNLMGKGFILPAPILPTDRFDSTLLPTPMATGQEDMPVAVAVYDHQGREVAQKRLGRLLRRDSVAVELKELIDGHLKGGYGHVELVYDFACGGSGDGWLHGLFRYEDRQTGHAADSSFGAHIFNTVLTYKNEPQSYAGRAPGLSTRLFLRLGRQPMDTICHLIYAASTPWHAMSETELILTSAEGWEIATHAVAIPCSGSFFFRYSEVFDAETRRKAGEDAYILIRDQTCRLFGFHGLIREDGPKGAFSLDHMFGF